MKKGNVQGYKWRYSELDKAITKSHDLTKIARIVVGKEWKSLTEEQQIILVNTFTQLSISAYVHNFKEFSGESFEFISEEITARGGAIIHSDFVLPEDKKC